MEQIWLEIYLCIENFYMTICTSQFYIKIFQPNLYIEYFNWFDSNLKPHVSEVTTAVPTKPLQLPDMDRVYMTKFTSEL